MKYVIPVLFLALVGLLIYLTPVTEPATVPEIEFIDRPVYIDRPVETIVYQEVEKIVYREKPVNFKVTSDPEMQLDYADDWESWETVRSEELEEMTETISNAEKEIIRLYQEASSARAEADKLKAKLKASEALVKALLENAGVPEEEDGGYDEAVARLEQAIKDYSLRKNSIGLGVVYADDFYYGGQYYRSLGTRVSVGGGAYYSQAQNKLIGLAGFNLHF